MASSRLAEDDAVVVLAEEEEEEEEGPKSSPAGACLGGRVGGVSAPPAMTTSCSLCAALFPLLPRSLFPWSSSSSSSSQPPQQPPPQPPSPPSPPSVVAMGCCGLNAESKDDAEEAKKQKQRNKEIDRMIQKDKQVCRSPSTCSLPDQTTCRRLLPTQVYRATHRLLLLGAGESGKSTLVKQVSQERRQTRRAPPLSVPPFAGRA